MIACFVIGGIGILLILRTQWIHKKRMWYLDRFKTFRNRRFQFHLERGAFDVAAISLFDDWARYGLDLLWSFDRMVMSFWVWDFRKMTHDRRAYDEMMGGRAKVVPFRRVKAIH